ncbi:unnamed protein product [[Candida] boidinii]|nr:unnamed protein product [[Candida] boidinii]
MLTTFPGLSSDTSLHKIPASVLAQHHNQQQQQQQQQPVAFPGSSELSTPINSTPLTPFPPNSDLLSTPKHHSSISFQCPPLGSKHRGSISARPSQTNIAHMDSPITSSSGIPSSRLPVNKQPTSHFPMGPTSTLNTPISAVLPHHPLLHGNTIQTSTSSSSNNIHPVNAKNLEKQNNSNNSAVNFSLGLSSRQNSTDTVIRQQQQQGSQHNELRACISASTRSSLASITSPVFKPNNNSNSDISSPALNNTNCGITRKDKDTESLVSFPGSSSAATAATAASAVQYQENNGLGLGFVTSNTDLITPVTPYSTLSLHNNSKPSTPISIGTNNTNSIKQQKKGSTTKAIIQTPTGPIVPFTEYMSKEDDDKIHILIGATGSVATIKIPMIIDKLFKIYGVDKLKFGEKKKNGQIQ